MAATERLWIRVRHRLTRSVLSVMRQRPRADRIDSGSELDESDGVFSPPITPGSSSPPTPASDTGVGEYFTNVLGSSMEDSADQKPSKLSLSGTTDWRSLDTALLESNYPEEVAQEEAAALAEPAMILSKSPDPSSDLNHSDFDELELAPSESPPPSRAPSPTPSGTSND
jgi:hypothetical protein